MYYVDVLCSNIFFIQLNQILASDLAIKLLITTWNTDSENFQEICGAAQMDLWLLTTSNCCQGRTVQIKGYHSGQNKLILKLINY